MQRFIEMSVTIWISIKFDNSILYCLSKFSFWMGVDSWIWHFYCLCLFSNIWKAFCLLYGNHLHVIFVIEFSFRIVVFIKMSFSEQKCLMCLDFQILVYFYQWAFFQFLLTNSFPCQGHITFHKFQNNTRFDFHIKTWWKLVILAV